MSRAGRFIPPVLWMAVIFAFSTYNFGSEQTGAVIGPLVRFFYPSIPQDSLETVHFVIRKAGHITEYAVLAFLWQRAFSVAGAWRHSPFMPAFLVCVLYAFSDEWHQSFVEDRTPSPLDVLLDACGSEIPLLGLGIGAKMRGLK